MLPDQEDTATRQSRSERLEARISKEQKQLFVRAARLTGRSLTDFIVSSAQEAANRTIQEHEIMVLGQQDQEAFVAALLEDSPPGDKLRAAARRYMDQR